MDESLDSVLLTESAFWQRPDRDEVFARFRAERPVAWHPEPATDILPAGRGFWSITRHADVRRVSREAATFCSGLGTEIVDLPTDVHRAYAGMMNMDAPEHTRLRKIVRGAFTPRRVEALAARTHEIAAEIVAEAVAVGDIEAVDDLAMKLPLCVVGDLFGIPEGDLPWVLRRTTEALGFGDPEVGTFDDSLAAARDLAAFGADIGRQRRVRPGDDLTSVIVRAEVDGESLTDEEVGSFFELLVTAGIETTGTATAHGLLQLALHPEQAAAWRLDPQLGTTAVEEIVRWSTPVMHFRRTATADAELGGVDIAAGDKVVVWYISANRDEAVFDEPRRFDIGRQQNDHLGFGGGGPHFCLGANLARLELKAVFNELLRRTRGLELLGEPVPLASIFANGVRRLPFRLVSA